MNAFREKVRGFIQKIKHSKKLSIIAILILVAAIPTTVYLAQKITENRQYANTNQATITVDPTTINPGGTVNVSWTLGNSTNCAMYRVTHDGTAFNLYPPTNVTFQKVEITRITNAQYEIFPYTNGSYSGPELTKYSTPFTYDVPATATNVGIHLIPSDTNPTSGIEFTVTDSCGTHQDTITNQRASQADPTPTPTGSQGPTPTPNASQAIHIPPYAPYQPFLRDCNTDEIQMSLSNGFQGGCWYVTQKGNPIGKYGSGQTTCVSGDSTSCSGALYGCKVTNPYNSACLYSANQSCTATANTNAASLGYTCVVSGEEVEGQYISRFLYAANTTTCDSLDTQTCQNRGYSTCGVDAATHLAVCSAPTHTPSCTGYDEDFCAAFGQVCSLNAQGQRQCKRAASSMIPAKKTLASFVSSLLPKAYADNQENGYESSYGPQPTATPTLTPSPTPVVVQPASPNSGNHTYPRNNFLRECTTAENQSCISEGFQGGCIYIKTGEFRICHNAPSQTTCAPNSIAKCAGASGGCKVAGPLSYCLYGEGQSSCSAAQTQDFLTRFNLACGVSSTAFEGYTVGVSKYADNANGCDDSDTQICKDRGYGACAIDATHRATCTAPTANVGCTGYDQDICADFWQVCTLNNGRRECKKPTTTPTVTTTITQTPSITTAPTNLTGAETLQLFRKRCSSPLEDCVTGTTQDAWDAVGPNLFLNCQQTMTTPPTTPVLSSSCAYQIPPDARLGSYVIRMLAADKTTVLGESPVITVTTNVPPPPPFATLSASLQFPGIGKTPGNTNPKHTTRSASLTFFDKNNQLVGTTNGVLTYNAKNGTFDQVFAISNLCPPNTPCLPPPPLPVAVDRHGDPAANLKMTFPSVPQGTPTQVQFQYQMVDPQPNDLFSVYKETERSTFVPDTQEAARIINFYASTCLETPNNQTRASGSCNINTNNLQPGRYSVRLFANNGFTDRLALTEFIVIDPAAPSPTMGITISPLPTILPSGQPPAFIPFPEGAYTVKIWTPQFLVKQLPGIVTIKQDQTVTLPSITLVTGDVNGDNILNILDYNLIATCYGEDKIDSDTCKASPHFDDAIGPLADLDDNGKVDGIDVNLFIKSLATREGD